MVRSHMQGRQDNFWAHGQKETCPPPPPILQISDTQTKSTTVCHKQGISTAYRTESIEFNKSMILSTHH